MRAITASFYYRFLDIFLVPRSGHCSRSNVAIATAMRKDLFEFLSLSLERASERASERGKPLKRRLPLAPARRGALFAPPLDFYSFSFFFLLHLHRFVFVRATRSILSRYTRRGMEMSAHSTSGEY